MKHYTFFCFFFLSLFSLPFSPLPPSLCPVDQTGLKFVETLLPLTPENRD